jgi:uncharacterized phage protein (TIGR01671 family)
LGKRIKRYSEIPGGIGMREIKFRVWNKREKRMFSTVYQLGSDCWKTTVQDCGDIVETFDMKDLCVLQYTGLRDENGIEIYEGDIVSQELRKFVNTETSYEGKRTEKTSNEYVVTLKGEVRWNRDSFEIYWTHEEGVESRRINTDVEVVGNIYQNPELLKE